MPSHDIRAEAHSVSVSAQKARLVVNLVRGKAVVQALDMLKFMTNGAAHPVSKVLASAVANAEENFGVSRDDLYVAKIFADEYPRHRVRITKPFFLGAYEVTAEAAGFKKLTREGITLNVGQTVNLDIVLEIGAVTEQVTVTSEAPLLALNFDRSDTAVR